MLAVATAACSNLVDKNNEEEEPQTIDVNDEELQEPRIHQIPLKGTRWKLAGLVDYNTGSIRVLEPNVEDLPVMQYFK